MGYGTDFSRQSHLPYRCQIVRYGSVPVRGGHCQNDRKVCPGFVKPQAANYVDIGVEKA